MLTLFERILMEGRIWENRLRDVIKDLNSLTKFFLKKKKKNGIVIACINIAIVIN